LTQLLLPALHLHLFPKSTIDVFILVLESDSLSNLLSAGMTVASAAVADAGIPMGGLAVGSVVVSKDKELLVDPSVEEEGGGDASVCMGIMPALGTVTNVWFTGEAEVDDACEVRSLLKSCRSPGLSIQMIEKAIAASKSTHTVLAQGLVEGAEDKEI
jgi:exosome complex component MTR3